MRSAPTDPLHGLLPVPTNVEKVEQMLQENRLKLWPLYRAAILRLFGQYATSRPELTNSRKVRRKTAVQTPPVIPSGPLAAARHGNRQQRSPLIGCLKHAASDWYLGRAIAGRLPRCNFGYPDRRGDAGTGRWDFSINIVFSRLADFPTVLRTCLELENYAYVDVHRRSPCRRRQRNRPY